MANFTLVCVSVFFIPFSLFLLPFITPFDSSPPHETNKSVTHQLFFSCLLLAPSLRPSSRHYHMCVCRTNMYICPCIAWIPSPFSHQKIYDPSKFSVFVGNTQKISASLLQQDGKHVSDSENYLMRFPQCFVYQLQTFLVCPFSRLYPSVASSFSFTLQRC